MSNFNIKYYLKLLSPPLTLLLVFISLWIIWWVFNLPPAEELARSVEGLFDKYGLPVILVSAIIEGMLLIGGYFPGVFVIFIGVILADSPAEAVIMVVVGTIGLFLAHILNYFLGRYGWYRILVKFGLKASIEQEQQKLLKRGPIAIFSSYWLPSIAAFTDTAAGILQMPFRTFVLFSFLGVVFWDSLVGFIVYQLGDNALSVVAPSGSTDLVVGLFIVVVWATILIFQDFRKRKFTSLKP